MANKKRKIDIYTKETSIPKGVCPYDYTWGSYEDYYDIYENEDYVHVSYSYINENDINELSPLYDELIPYERVSRRFGVSKNSGRYKFIDLESAYDTAKIRSIKIDKILNLIDENISKLNTIKDFHELRRKD